MAYYVKYFRGSLIFNKVLKRGFQMENIFDSKYFIISLDLKFYSFCLMFPRSSKSFVIFLSI